MSEFPKYQPTAKKPEEVVNKRKICTLEPAELEGRKYALQKGKYNDWAMAIADKYNLERLDFEVNDQGELSYNV